MSTELELVRLQVSSAVGAARLAARAVRHELPRDAACCSPFYTYRPAGNGADNGAGNDAGNGADNGAGNGAGNGADNGINGHCDGDAAADGCGCERFSWS